MEEERSDVVTGHGTLSDGTKGENMGNEIEEENKEEEERSGCGQELDSMNIYNEAELEEESEEEEENSSSSWNGLLNEHDEEVLAVLSKMDEEWKEYQDEMKIKEDNVMNEQPITFEMVLRRNVLLRDERDQNGNNNHNRGSDGITDEEDTDRIADDVFNLKRVRLDGEGIHRIDNLDCLGPNTMSLFLNNNHIHKMENLESLIFLKSLVLANNDISEWVDISFLKELILLDLSSNQLHSLPERTVLPASLTMLLLRNNPCASQPKYRDTVIARFPNLKMLDGTSVTLDSEEDYAKAKEKPGKGDGDILSSKEKGETRVKTTTNKKKKQPVPSSAPTPTPPQMRSGSSHTKAKKQMPQPPARKQSQSSSSKGSGFAQQRLERLRQIAASKKKEISSLKEKTKDLSSSIKTHKNPFTAEDDQNSTEVKEALKECVLGNSLDVDFLSDRILSSLKEKRDTMKMHSIQRRKELTEDFKERVEEIKQYKKDHRTLYLMSQMDQTTTSSRPTTASTLRANRCEDLNLGMSKDESLHSHLRQLVEETVDNAKRKAEEIIEEKKNENSTTLNKYTIAVNKESRPATATSRFKEKMAQKDDALTMEEELEENEMQEERKKEKQRNSTPTPSSTNDVSTANPPQPLQSLSHPLPVLPTVERNSTNERRKERKKKATSAKSRSNPKEHQPLRTASAGKKPRKLGMAQRRPTSGVRLKPIHTHTHTTEQKHAEK
eukprot:m.37271 g.37271  ORF g.37271 m.37271 type:complete len:723 (+) comp10143_c0_seq1:33-2201(+)